MSLAEYLAFEDASPLKHEFVAGEVYAMSGATTRHNLITLNIVRRLWEPARAHGCRIFATDVKLRVGADRIYYPDAIIVCGVAAEVELIIEEPTVIVEVMSRSTRATDRREKREAYQRIPSLRCYLIVEQRWREVHAYQRTAGGEWIASELQGDDELIVPHLDARLLLGEIYDDVPMPPLGVKEEDWELDDDEE
jgi:Uma2 family endonuclease